MAKRRSARTAAFLVLAAFATGMSAPSGHTGSLPEAEWDGAGRVSWESGYIVSYGKSLPSPEFVDPNQRRSLATKDALRKAHRNLHRLLLGVRVQDSLTVRDYLRQDTEFQRFISDELGRLPPWQVRVGSDGTVEAAFKLALGGEESVSELLGGHAERDESVGGTEVSSGAARVGGDADTGVTGVVLIVSGAEVVPALRPRILGEGGQVLRAFEDAAGEAAARSAYIAYYDHLEEALGDPVVGQNPLVVSAPAGRRRGTDLILPRLVEEVLAREDSGDVILAEAKVVVVRQ